MILTNEVGEIDVALIQTIIKASVGNPGSYATLGEIRYSVHMDKVSGVSFISLMCLENTKRLLS